MCLFCESNKKGKKSSAFTTAQRKEMEATIRAEVRAELEAEYGTLSQDYVHKQLQCLIDKMNEGVNQRIVWISNRQDQISKIEKYARGLRYAFQRGDIRSKEDLALISSKVEMLLR